jgi:hypothetical protein
MQATIDRIDEGVAVLIACGEKPFQITVPSSLLPHGSREGDIVSITIGRDNDATEAAKNRVARLIGRLKDK